jgi:hypothetical protein
LHEIYKDHIAPKIQEAEETFRAAGWISTASALAVSFSVPPVLEKLDKFLEVQPNAALATLAGVVLGITKVAIDAKKASEKKPEASFLLAVKKQDAARARVDGADYAGHALFAINEAANALYKVR